MKFNVFQSNTGDCLLVSGGGHHILVDGGLKGSFQDFARPALGKIAEQGEKLDLVCVSHMDSDHISGIIQLIDDVLAWRVFRFQESQGNKKFERPTFPEPPEISEIWHNTFEAQVGDVQAAFEETVTMQIQASILGQNDFLAQMGQNLITGEKQAIELTNMVAPSLLNIPLNKPVDGKPLMMKGDAPLTYAVGNMKLFLLGPFEEDLKRLHQQWEVWIKANQNKLKMLRDNVEENKKRLGLTAEEALGMTIKALTAELGNRTQVTIPNLASITFLVEEDERQILMTGDAHANEILKGLRVHGFLPEEGGALHVDILKLQHHGAEANIDEAFCRIVTADHYVFSGNGTHENPELAVINAVVSLRLENKETLTPFTLWFNSSEIDAGTELRSEHMGKVRERVEELVKGNEDLISFHFTDGEAGFEIDLD
jgi:beta-lactamase superfamily II metal-dependent hydrolase